MQEMLATQETQENKVRPAKMEPLEKTASQERWDQSVPQDLQDPKDHPAHKDHVDDLDVQDLRESSDQKDSQAKTDMTAFQESVDLLVKKVNKASLVPLARLVFQERQELTEPLDLQVEQESRAMPETEAIMENREPLVKEATRVQRELQEHPVFQERTEPMVVQELQVHVDHVETPVYEERMECLVSEAYKE